MSAVRRNRIRDLESRIEEANTAYWLRQDPILSDSEYDMLVEELKSLNPDNPLIGHIGNDNASGDKVTHQKPMLSLDKVYEWEDLVAWCSTVARNDKEVFRFSPKYDGISVEWLYQDGKHKLVTRGDGYKGTDISHLAPFIRVAVQVGGKPLHIPLILLKDNKDYHLPNGRYVGELLIRRHDFKVQKGVIPLFAEYKNERNGVAGFANTKAGSEKLNDLIMDGVPTNAAHIYLHRGHELVVPMCDIKNAEKRICNALRNYDDTPCDGIVCRLEDDGYAESLGSTEHHPKGAIALKFQEIVHQSIVRSIDWQVGNMAVTPVVNFDPIDIDGVTITRATCHNAKFIKDNKLTVGACVEIVRRGSVIPKVVRVYPVPDAEPVIPEECPSCYERLEWDGPELVCTNDECVDRIVNKIVCGLDRLGIKGIGESLTRRLVADFTLRGIMDLFLEVDDLEVLMRKRYTAHEIALVRNGIQRATKEGVDDAAWFASLCIPQASESYAKAVIKYTGSIMTLCEESSRLTQPNPNIPRLNTTANANALAFFRKYPSEIQAYYGMFSHTNTVETDKPKFCFTGAQSIPRRELYGKVTAAGGIPTDNIREATYLVCSDPSSTSTKMQYAKQHEIKIVTFEEFEDILANLSR